MGAEAFVMTSCGACRFWQHTDLRSGFCRRHAPAASDRATQVARWPETRAADGCGEGEVEGGPSSEDQLCRGCVFWHRPGVGIDPLHRGDHVGSWWEDAGWCRRFAPRPGIDIGEHAFWRVTHASDHCFDGKPGGSAPERLP